MFSQRMGSSPLVTHSPHGLESCRFSQLTMEDTLAIFANLEELSPSASVPL